ncbi:diacylglycerol kinase [Megasphaera cerevisiae DSM 20462]|uniref:Dihydrofolate reductase n=1 Tax=Megasphaera cerevisiae DSM 20462 TaxID=1122219 RepID=A0A0J6WWS2_9FIRM|nr:dihydrofolate reductase [Megasphaera cerevisiae]KMO86287.1 diacylglycerol kinase [Megasphaera cerevisiae DSM 20462]MCI1751125.1 dihydrofolate reductase [Megasphaera cerevisiae]OKY53176.1 diacylglycerol kinase [Megasphaera cerevisiae]SJZ44985.1 dihydrofolate reductase [Megasphaera cerevisiae DSM 20462]
MIHMIAAVDQAGGIGRNNHLLCHLSADLKHFKKLTMGHAIIMGRKTFESLPGILPGRRHIILTHQEGYCEGREGISVYHSIDSLYSCLDEDQEYFVIGGASLYTAFIDKADTLYLTEIAATFPADTFFPMVDKTQWYAMSCEAHEADEKNPHDFTFYHYVRKVSEACDSEISENLKDI